MANYGGSWRGERSTLDQEIGRARKLIRISAPPESTITPEQWCDRARYTSPIQRLAIALVESAVRDYARPKFRDIAGEWIRSDDATPFSLRWTCDALDLDFGHTQRRLLARAAHIAEQVRTKLKAPA